MALATRELELVIIARDRASATLARIGGAFTILGAGAARFGAEGIGFFAGVTQEAIDFRKQVGLIFTQVEVAGATYTDVLNLIRDEARKTAVPIDDLAESAYDIFSTLTLDNMSQAQVLLDAFAKSAVAGDAPIRDIGRAVIAWINALNVEPTLENVNRIMDVQFELVRKGAGTYTEFADVIGKAIPPFVSANQSVEELAGTVAFLTRNGLSAAEAATSAARGVELLYSAKAIKGLQKVGISVEDGNGKFRSMDDLLGDVVEHFRGLSDAERRLEFKEIFGQGRIQARRFFDLLLKEGNFEEFLFLMGEVRDSAGGVADAFDIMTAEPAVQLEMLRNRWAVLRQEIGDYFIPFLTSKLFPLLDRLLTWWESMDDLQKNNLIKWAAFATIFITVGGALTAIIGSGILLLGFLQAFTESLGTALLLGGGVVSFVAALAGAIALAVIDWDKFVEIFGPWWDKIVGVMEPIVNWIKNNWPEAWQTLEDGWNGIVEFFSPGGGWEVAWSNALTTLQDTWNGIVEWWNSNIVQGWEGFTTFLNERASSIQESLDKITGAGHSILPIFQQIGEELGPILAAISGAVKAWLEFFALEVDIGFKVISWIWERWGDNIVEIVRIVIKLLGGIIEGFLIWLTGVWEFWTGILTGDWSKAWEGLKNIVKGVVDTIKEIIGGLFAFLWNQFEGVTGIEIDWSNFWDNLKTIAAEKVGTIMQILTPLPTLLWKLSPWNKNSPSLVEEVTTGLAAVQKQYRTQLRGLHSTTAQYVPNIQAMLQAGLAANQANQAMTASSRASSVGARSQAAQGLATHIDKQVIFESGAIRVESNADPMEIARAIEWEVLNS